MDHHPSNEPRSAFEPTRRRIGTILTLIATIGWWGVTSGFALDELTCEKGTILAGGRPDPTIFSDEASRGVRASWCERYDAYGVATRTGPYRDVYPGGALRTEAHYVRSRLQGPVTVHNEDGGLFLRGFLAGGRWVGDLEIFHPNGTVWLSTHFDHGVLEGDARSHYADGALESETHFQKGREDGLARSFYPSSIGGHLKSEAFVEADRIVGRHRVFDRRGTVIQAIDWATGPLAWHTSQPGPASTDSTSATPSSSPPDSTNPASRPVRRPTAADRRQLRD